MKTTKASIVLILGLAIGMLPLGPLGAQQKGAGGGPGDGRSMPQRGSVKSGALPDLNAYTAEGQPIKVRELCQGNYTVLVAGCLTCPQFREGYPQIEALNADFAARGVKFYYFYKSLRHPELEGYVQAQNMTERFMQLAEARKKFGTHVPWIADTLDDSIRVGLQSGPNSIYLISPQGKIIYGSDRIEGNQLREVLTQAVGKPEQVTSLSALHLPFIGRQPRAVNETTALTVERPAGMTILAITPIKPETTYYVKLRAEADAALLRTGTGRLFLGFYPDPILKAHWNNLTTPMKYRLDYPEGVTVTPAEASAAVGQGDSDTQPRQFWVDIKANKVPGDFKLTLDYYGCTPDMCQALTHEYIIHFAPENRGSNTYGFNRGPRGRGGPQGQPRAN